MSFRFYFPPLPHNRLEKALALKSYSLAKRWEEIKPILIEEIDTRYEEAYPYFNEKASAHGEQGILFLSSTLPDDLVDSLTADEVFILMSACYVHDIGLTTEFKPYKPIPHAKHFEQGRVIIKNNEKLPFTTQEREILGILARWHSILEWSKNGKNENYIAYNHLSDIRVHLLVQLIQLADLYHRAVDVTWKNFPAPKENDEMSDEDQNEITLPIF